MFPVRLTHLSAALLLAAGTARAEVPAAWWVYDLADPQQVANYGFGLAPDYSGDPCAVIDDGGITDPGLGIDDDGDGIIDGDDPLPGGAGGSDGGDDTTVEDTDSFIEDWLDGIVDGGDGDDGSAGGGETGGDDGNEEPWAGDDDVGCVPLTADEIRAWFVPVAELPLADSADVLAQVGYDFGMGTGSRGNGDEPYLIDLEVEGGEPLWLADLLEGGWSEPVVTQGNGWGDLLGSARAAGADAPAEVIITPTADYRRVYISETMGDGAGGEGRGNAGGANPLAGGGSITFGTLALLALGLWRRR